MAGQLFVISKDGSNNFFEEFRWNDVERTGGGLHRRDNMLKFW